VSLKEAISQPPFAIYARPIYAYLRERYELGPIFSCSGHRCILGVLQRRPPSTERVVTDLTGALDGAVLTVDTNTTRHQLEGDARRPVAVVSADWPYLGPVLGLRPLAEAETRIAFDLPSVTTRLRARAGINPARWAEFEPGVTELGVSHVDPQGETVLWRATFDPERRYEDRAWRDIDIPLSPGADARVVLWARTDRPGGYPIEHAGFERPRLVAPPGS
jgi:hypothetical protein